MTVRRSQPSQKSRIDYLMVLFNTDLLRSHSMGYFYFYRSVTAPSGLGTPQHPRGPGTSRSEGQGSGGACTARVRSTVLGRETSVSKPHHMFPARFAALIIFNKNTVVGLKEKKFRFCICFKLCPTSLLKKKIYIS